MNLDMADTQRKRSRNFTELEKELLLDIIMKYIHIVENKKTDAKSIQDKNECWQHITQEFNAKNFNGTRMYAQLRMLYDNLKKNARREKIGLGEKVKSKAVEKLLTMLTTPCDTSATPQFSNMVYYDSKLNGSGSAEDTSQSSDVILNATPITNSEAAQEQLVSSFKSEVEDAEPACFDDASFETYQLPLIKSSEKSDHKGYKRKLNHLLEEMHNFVKKKSDDSQWKKKLYNIKTEQAEVELQIKKVELEIKIQELEIHKKELELKNKELEIKNKELEQYAHSN